jgi:hypothetical protein
MTPIIIGALVGVVIVLIIVSERQGKAIRELQDRISELEEPKRRPTVNDIARSILE